MSVAVLLSELRLVAIVFDQCGVLTFEHSPQFVERIFAGNIQQFKMRPGLARQHGEYGIRFVDAQTGHGGSRSLADRRHRAPLRRRASVRQRQTRVITA